MTRLTLDDIFDLTYSALIRCGATPENAKPTAQSICDAEAEGIRNVGLAYLPVYCEHLLCGKVNGQAQPVVVRQEGAVIQVDADFGFCHPAFMLAFEPFVALTRQLGVSVLSIDRSYSAAVVGWFNDLLAQEGLVSLAFANASSAVAAWGGKRPFFGTNPLSFGAPRAKDGPIIVDMATSATAKVNIMEAAALGREIPLGWAQDADGQPTTDPKAGLAGSLMPVGGYKGFGLGLMVDILAAGLTGGKWSFEASSLIDNMGGPPAVGQLFIALDPCKVGGEALATRIELLISAMLSEEGVRLPGVRRHQARATAEREGVSVPEQLIAQIEGYADLVRSNP